jgi:hypothetical protein
LSQKPRPASAPAPKPKHNHGLQTPWTPERNRFLAHFWVHELDKSAGWIAAWLNEHTDGLTISSANAVIGRAYRMKLPSRATDRSQQGRKVGKAHAKQVKQANPRKGALAGYREPVSSVVPLCVPLLKSREQHCRYVVGDPKDQTFCGHEHVEGSVWCAGHRTECTG